MFVTLTPRCPVVAYTASERGKRGDLCQVRGHGEFRVQTQVRQQHRRTYRGSTSTSCSSRSVLKMSAKATTAAKAKKEPSKIVKAYLVAYNVAQVLGWSYLFFQLTRYFISPPQDTTLWEYVKLTVVIFQNAALLEVVHAALGFVVSNVFMTAAQVYSRVMVVCLVLLATPTAPASIGLPMALFAWTVTEIIRYSFYALNLLGAVPHFLIWCRYTFFIILYPIGVSGELLCIWAASQYAAETSMWSFSLPNALNFTFDYGYFLIANMLAYIPVFPQLYLYMFAQRKKVVKGAGSSKKTK